MTDPYARRGGWRWLEIRRNAIAECALAHLDDEHARNELLDPASGIAVPQTSAWYEFRQRAIEIAAIAVLKDRHADADDRWCTRAARLALENPAADWAESLMHETGVGTAHNRKILNAISKETK